MKLTEIFKKIGTWSIALGSLVLSVGALQSCKDDALELTPDNDGVSESGKSQYLSFSLGLQSLGAGSRAGASDVEAYEDDLDGEKLYIMFFLRVDEDGKILDIIDKNVEGTDMLYKMFEPGDPTISIIPIAYNTVDQFDKSWYVRISLSEFQNEEDRKQFYEVLKNHDFRIAVLANVDTNKKVVLKEGQYNKESNTLTEGSDINDIHRQTENTDCYVYGDIIDADLKNANYDLYKFLYTEYDGKIRESKYLGHYSSWVENRSDDTKTSTAARSYIKEKFSPSADESPYNGYFYLWSVWNFSGGDDNPAVTYEKFASEWKTVNGEILTKKIKEASNNKIPSFRIGEEIRNEEGIITQKEKFYFEFKDFVSSDIFAKPIEETTSRGNLYGISLPQQSYAGEGSSSSTYNRINPDDGGYVAFNAKGSGHLKITARASEDQKVAKVIAQVGKKETHNVFLFNSQDIKDSDEWEINIPGDSQTIYIYTASESGCTADIFKIEYIQDTYLYETDRQGIKPDPETQLIPMYGVSTYKKIEGLWKEGTSFDLDDYSGTSPDYDGFETDYSEENPKEKTYFHPVPLLRSVAKVIVRIPKALQSKNVYLRSVNSYARWEPTDVRSNTLDIWTDGTEDFVGKHSTYCEFYHLKDQPVFYNPSEKDLNAQMASYKKKLNWYYGTWMDQNLIQQVQVNDIEETINKTHGFTYPHIMNAVISRSDFVAFLEAGTEEIYDKYVLYVPEKYVDDPDNIIDPNGIENSIPKVCHIEFRIGDDPADNLDDNNCYRIYFTKNGFYGTNPPDLRDEAHSWEKLYEQNLDVLKNHWPILRNHVYQFTVEDINRLGVIVNLEILPWKKTTDIEVAW